MQHPSFALSPLCAGGALFLSAAVGGAEEDFSSSFFCNTPFVSLEVEGVFSVFFSSTTAAAATGGVGGFTASTSTTAAAGVGLLAATGGVGFGSSSSSTFLTTTGSTAAGGAGDGVVFAGDGGSDVL